jgi:uncharacterized damage-inducible protein DinB
MTKTLEELKYPIGPFQFAGDYDEATRARYLESIRSLPARLKATTESLSEEKLNEPYRPGGWTIKQLVHHIADSHVNSYIRFKLAVTEDNPAIKPYDQDGWANLRDSAVTPISVSVQLLEAIHTRWVHLLEGFSPKEWQRTAFHPEKQRPVSLNEFLALYAWHCEHHLQQIKNAI